MTDVRYCVMQPYFFPHAPYYRLFVDVDVFVIFDNAQFPRRGRVHRCQLEDHTGQMRWLTLPLVASGRATPISAVRLREGAGQEVVRALRAFPEVAALVESVGGLREILSDPPDALIDFLSEQLVLVAGIVSRPPRFVRASTVVARGSEDYQDYIIRVGQQLGAEEYVNLPGGRDLYHSTRFHEAGLRLSVLPPTPPGPSILQTWDESVAWLQSFSRSASLAGE